MKKLKILAIIIAILTICLIPIYSQANPDSVGIDDFEKYADQQAVAPRYKEMVGVILGVVQTIGSLASIICLTVLGVKYMMGSAEEKAEYKKTLMPYVLGAIMVLGISNLLQLIYKIAIDVF